MTWSVQHLNTEMSVKWDYNKHFSFSYISLLWEWNMKQAMSNISLLHLQKLTQKTQPELQKSLQQLGGF